MINLPMQSQPGAHVILSVCRTDRLRNANEIEVSEEGSAWRDMPAWMSFLIRVGHAWLTSSHRRRIGLISMPCDSAAAGLITLGAVRQRLEQPDANDVATHFERLRSLAGRKPPVVLQCTNMRGQFELDSVHPTGMLWVKRISRSPNKRIGETLKMTIGRGKSIEWHVEGEPSVQVLPGRRLPYSPIYNNIVESKRHLVLSNLQQSDSVVCLAGRVTGERATRSAAALIRFRTEHLTADLSQLLTIHGWSRDTVSRVSFFNSRSEKLDRSTMPPALVVADGHAAFLKAIAYKAFRDSDIVGVVHRTIEREDLEAVGEKMGSLSQWYQPDDELLSRLPPPPRGMSLAIMSRS